MPEGTDTNPPNCFQEAPSVLSTELIAKLNSEGYRFSNETIRTIDECRDAIAIMPPGQTGIVLGSGPNTASWYQKGWETLDLTETEHPTYTADANNLAKVVCNKRYDYVLAERISTSKIAGNPVLAYDEQGKPFYEPALGQENLAIQATLVLKPGGRLIIQAADFGGAEQFNTLLTVEEYAKVLRKHGFIPILEVHQIVEFNDPQKRKRGVQVTWYATKH